MLQAEGAAHDTCTCMTPVYLYLGLPCFGVNSARPLGLETPLGLDDMHGNCSLEACLRLTCGPANIWRRRGAATRLSICRLPSARTLLSSARRET